MPIKAKYCRIWVNEFDFSGQSNSLEVDISTDKQDVSTFQATSKEYLTLDPDGKISQKGFFNDAAAGYAEQEVAESILNAEALFVAALFGTQTAACPAYVAPNTNTESMQITAAIGGVIEFNGAWPAGAGIKRGLRLFSGQISAVGAQAGVDLGSAGSNGGYVWLFVQGIGGAGSITVTVQSDTTVGFSAPATEATFNFSAPGGYQAVMVGAVGRYVRLNCTALGGATSVTVGAIVAVNGVTM
jgi:hypothetical protein